MNKSLEGYELILLSLATCQKRNFGKIMVVTIDDNLSLAGIKRPLTSPYHEPVINECSQICKSTHRCK